MSLRDIKISAVIFLSGLEMCVKKSLSSNFRPKKKYAVYLKFAPFTSQVTSEARGVEAEITSISDSPFNQ